MGALTLPFEYSFGEDLESTTSAAIGTAAPIGRDLTLDPVTHDLLIASGDLSLVSDLDAIRQEADIRMRFFLGEWFLDSAVGIPYFQNILVKAPNMAAIRTIFSDELLKSAGVVSIKELRADFDRRTRSLAIVWSAECNTGELLSSSVNFEA